ncbi:MAG TPA: tRNA preQ1(34) S-adenosylmethionine ribosyltransferase-isomerase QueA [Blastocatellia bacterium]|nr:tRNA preQ1(34) S-adenosylmethionine ribosyltransferase-isomerase QueA [Blastocatellia bacterium]
MHISEFNFELPQELIAQQPLEPRDQSRMLVVDRRAGKWRDSYFAELPTLLSANDVLVINNTRVFPARVLGHRVVKGKAGAKIEALLVRRLTEDEWEVMAKPGRALPVGAQLDFGAGRLQAEVTSILADGRRVLRFSVRGNLDQIVDEIGNTPLPPYIKRDYDEAIRLDEPRYQTIYAKERGAIAAPTAGLHFTERIFAELKARGVVILEITHHVGAATFQPVRVENIAEHQIEAERYEISAVVAATLNQAKAAGKRIIAVGTTTTRAVESAIDENGIIQAGNKSTDLFIYPGFQFRAINALITNFHLPQSSLLMLVAAFAGRELSLNAYRHAVQQQYRFYSYGDCMFIG